MKFFDVEAEKALLGALLVSPEVIGEVGDRLMAEHFSEHLRPVFLAIARVRHDGAPVLPATVTAAMNEEVLHALGGAAFITGLACQGNPSLHVARHWTGVIIDLWKNREARAVAESLCQRVESGAGISAFDEALARIDRIRFDDSKPLTSLVDVSAGPPDPRKTVLGNRFLCIGGAMLFVGPSGIGKSSASMQQDILWALGREAFGIKPARRLNILTIQAENDAEDLAEMRDGVMAGLGLSAEDREALGVRVFYETEGGRMGADFLKFVDQRLSFGQFDLLRIDPLQGYLGDDIKDAQVTAEFLRSGLTPILHRHRVACVLNHHTPKTNNRDTSEWKVSDWMYAGAGSADITNWARAAVIVDSTHAPHVFKFIAAKRGARVGWVDEFGEREIMRYYCHAQEGKGMYWREATPEDVNEVQNSARASRNGNPPKTKEDLKALIPKTGAIAKNLLISNATAAGIGQNRARGLISQLLSESAVYEWRIPRPGTQPEIRISLHPETLLGVS